MKKKRYTMIFFLREKDNERRSVCTIEVSPDKRLIQLKAFGNQTAPEEVKEFVKKWGKEKGIDLNCYDMR